MSQGQSLGHGLISVRVADAQDEEGRRGHAGGEHDAQRAVAGDGDDGAADDGAD